MLLLKMVLSLFPFFAVFLKKATSYFGRSPMFLCLAASADFFFLNS